MKQALAEGGFSVDDIGHLNAHGTATPVNDKTESAAWNALLGDRAAKIPVTSVKGCVGHMLGAAGAIEGYRGGSFGCTVALFLLRLVLRGGSRMSCIGTYRCYGEL
mgnify:CR=1 FL=1